MWVPEDRSDRGGNTLTFQPPKLTEEDEKASILNLPQITGNRISKNHLLVTLDLFHDRFLTIFLSAFFVKIAEVQRLG